MHRAGEGLIAFTVCFLCNISGCTKFPSFLYSLGICIQMASYPGSDAGSNRSQISRQKPSRFWKVLRGSDPNDNRGTGASIASSGAPIYEMQVWQCDTFPQACVVKLCQ